MLYGDQLCLFVYIPLFHLTSKHPTKLSIEFDNFNRFHKEQLQSFFGKLVQVTNSERMSAEGDEKSFVKAFTCTEFGYLDCSSTSLSITLALTLAIYTEASIYSQIKKDKIKKYRKKGKEKKKLLLFYFSFFSSVLFFRVS